MSYGETLSRCDTTAFITALALVADAKRRERAGRASITAIQARVCARFDLARSELLSRCNKRRIARPRQIGMYIAFQAGGRTRAQVGRHFGGFSSWTVMHACRQIEKLRADDPDIEAAVCELTAALSIESGVNADACSMWNVHSRREGFAQHEGA